MKMNKLYKQVLLAGAIVSLTACTSQTVHYQGSPINPFNLKKTANLKVKLELPTSKLQPYQQVSSKQNGFSVQFIEPTDIFFGDGQVIGRGIGPFPADVPGNPFQMPKGSNTVAVSWSAVPIGRNRVVTVTGLDRFSAAIAGHYEVKGVTDVNAGGNLVTVNFQTTPTARVIERLITDNHPTADTADNAAVQAFVDRLVNNDTGAPADDIDYSMIDHDAIALFMEANGGNLPNIIPPMTAPERALYTNVAGTITGTITGLQEPYLLGAAPETVFPPVTIVNNDPASLAIVNAANVQAGSPVSFNYTINNVTPGNNYTLSVQSPYHATRTAVINIAPGATVNQDFTFVAGDKRHFFGAAIASNGNQVWRYQDAQPIDVLVVTPASGIANLQGWWRGEGNANDASGNGNHATEFNGIGYAAGAPAVGGQAFNCDGTNDYAAIDNLFFNSAGQIPTMTVSAWVNTTQAAGGVNGNWAILDYDRSEFFNFFVRGTNGRLGFATRANAGGIVDFYGTTPVNDGAWHHVVAVYDGTDKRLYVDGVLDATQVNPHGGQALGRNITRYGMICDGSEATAFNGARNNIHYNGMLDEIMYFDRDLTAVEITNLFTSPPIPSAVGWNVADHLNSVNYAIEQLRGLYAGALTLGAVNVVTDSDPLLNAPNPVLPVIGNAFPANPADPNSPNNPANNGQLVGDYDLYIRWRTDFGCPTGQVGVSRATFVDPVTFTTIIELATNDCTNVIPYDIARQVAAHEISHALAGMDHSATATDLLFPTVNSTQPVNLNPSINDVNTVNFLFDANASTTNTDRVP